MEIVVKKKAQGDGGTGAKNNFINFNDFCLHKLKDLVEFFSRGGRKSPPRKRRRKAKMNIQERTQQQVIDEVKELAEEMAAYLESKAQDIRLAMILLREIDEDSTDNHFDNRQACEQIYKIFKGLLESHELVLNADGIKLAANIFKAWDDEKEVRG